ncbi:MAG: thioredoxin fold domain-containing protein [Ruminococcus sp.]|nr:thioredoxin fold domain-containing protein [Ruminococcus sp.]
MAERVSAADFDEKVLRSEIPVAADFYSDSCIPCKRLSPVISRLEEEFSGRVKFVKVNVNFDGELAERFDVLAAPTIVFFRDGSETGRTRGAVTQQELTDAVEELIK